MTRGEGIVMTWGGTLVSYLTGWTGNDLVVNEFIYNSFLFVTIGAFGIAGLEKFAPKK
jgi:hypothetical protein